MTQPIIIIDYQAGNTASLGYALERLDVHYVITDQPTAIKQAAKIIFPGVGRAKPAMRDLEAAGLSKLLPQLTVPFLGICLGLQLLAEFSEEDSTPGLSVIPGQVKRFQGDIKVPQMGWNQVHRLQPSPLWNNVPDNSYFYFANSFYLDSPARFVLGSTDYGLAFPSVIQKDNFYATQFHPEKSGELGMQLLRNFCDL
jgi:glutamine amidotransferase